MNNEYMKSVFSLLLDGMYGEGGDGTTKLICKHHNFTVVANNFSAYIKENKQCNLTRYDQKDHVSFCDGQECVIIASPEIQPHQFDDLVIII